MKWLLTSGQRTCVVELPDTAVDWATTAQPLQWSGDESVIEEAQWEIKFSGGCSHYRFNPQKTIVAELEYIMLNDRRMECFKPVLITEG
ncbi:hypothetical protein H6F43_03285 [Leptolyngbya sp. FACHB-36]|uniref:hypothetical protein n=1 Tax=Leptolyngbya sp. FACHB-36 TaxID=2692808 RepID=UPI0016806534|nr:hypothetical protein [Leptolyngbya sp. FACHB-36]MBD2019207.1 hypothetical protein [Leptolyngbya sp. FACHB-36]